MESEAVCKLKHVGAKHLGLPWTNFGIHAALFFLNEIRLLIPKS